MTKPAVFVAGSRQISELPADVMNRLFAIIETRVQTSPVIKRRHRAVRRHLAYGSYPNGLVHCMKDYRRNSVGNWPTRQFACPTEPEAFDYFHSKERSETTVTVTVRTLRNCHD